MTIRERIADWLGAGKIRMLTEDMDFYRSELARSNTDHVKASDRLLICEDALRQIAALETPKANATVRKMARIARGASA